MDTARILRDFRASLTLPATDERRLLGGAVAVTVGYALWLAATGAALRFGLGVGTDPTSAAAWESTGTGAIAAAVVLWVLVPAAVVTYLLDRAVTNPSGNVRQYYRVRHPLLLVVPALLVALACLGAAVAAEGVTVPALAAATVLGLFALARTVPASYRVFSLSRPRLVELFVFLALAVAAVGIPVSAASVTGRQAIVDAAAAGIGASLGTSAVETLLLGSTTIAGTTVPYLLGAMAAVPTGLALLYGVVQVVVGGIQRVQKPEVPQKEIRAGQRHPNFARPTYGDSSERSTNVSRTSASDGGSSVASPTSGSGDSGATDSATTSTTATASGSAADAGTDTADDTDTDDVDDGTDEGEDGDDEFDDANHTRVFTPPADGGDVDFDAGTDTTAAGGSGSTAGGEETAVVSESGYRCPSCDDRFDADASFRFCPTCGSELEET